MTPERLARKWTQVRGLTTTERIDRAVREALEEAEKVMCEVMCDYCRRGVPRDPARPKNGHAIYHTTGTVYANCKAARIASLRS